MFWKQLATTFQYLGTAPTQHRDGCFITYSLSVSRRCMVAYLARSIDTRCRQPDWDAAVEQFSLLFYLWLLSDKRGAEISQKLHQIVELISWIEGLLQSWSSTPLQVTSFCWGVFQIFVVCWNKGWIVDKQVDNLSPVTFDFFCRLSCLLDFQICCDVPNIFLLQETPRFK